MFQPKSTFVIATALVAAFASTSFAERPKPIKKAKPIRALLVLGGCCHEYDKQKDVLTKGISARANIEFTIAYDPDTGTTHLNPIYNNPDWANGFDVVIHDECTSDVKDMPVVENILRPHKNGLPAVFLHCGMHSFRTEGFPKTTAWFDFTGLPSTGHGPQVPITLTFVDQKSPITKGLEGWTTVNEELYNNVAGDVLPTAHALARGRQTIRDKDGKETVADCVSVWTNTYNGKTKVFATTIGHNTATVADNRYLDLVTRGLLWTVGKLTKDGKPANGYGPAN
jgi:type 1 glutamine amidotransferase